MKIGRFPEVTVEQARKIVTRLSGKLAQGDNPAQDRRMARSETLLGELFSMYITNHARPRKRTWQGDQAQYNRYLASWKVRKLSEITRADVAALHAKIGRDRGIYAANRLLALLSTIYGYAASLGHDGPNPAKGVKRFKEQSRDRFMHQEELNAFFQALNHEDTPELWRDYFALALLTGARRSNVLAMKWADLELQRGLWRIGEAESKNKEPLICILHPAAVEILQRRAVANAAQDAPSEYVFPGPGRQGHAIAPARPWQRILDRAGIRNLHPHDLRRTVGSWMGASGASLSIVGKALGHRSVAPTAVYARLDPDSVRASVTTAVDSMLAAANGTDIPKALPANWR